jgi:hypothetical protein
MVETAHYERSAREFQRAQMLKHPNELAVSIFGGPFFASAIKQSSIERVAALSAQGQE